MPRIDNDIKLDFKDVLFRPKRSTLKSRSEVELVRKLQFRNSGNSYEGIPIIAANMDTTGTFEVAEALAMHKMFTAIHKHYSLQQWQDFANDHKDVLQYVAVSSGASKDDMDRLDAILSAVPALNTICLDVANGYSELFVECVRNVRKKYPNHTVIAGNVVTGEMVEELILSGADIIKVGIGPGSVCTTRKKTGVGYPQISAVLECADAAHGLGGHIISDGGCTCPGDVAKAFGKQSKLSKRDLNHLKIVKRKTVTFKLGAGADFVMLGGMFAGHDQSGGELIETNGKKVKLFYGMSSAVAMHKYVGKVAEYRASEGKCVEIPYRGDINDTVLDVLGGVRSTCTYVGASKLKELSKRTTFIRVTQQLNEIFKQNEK
ncbi:GMP reductase 2 [Trichoplax sp. H2]|nr:GMP reductase 2 [Trichoplax sp. H2]|eukprot:RDD46911.1 GMP reductase 2 [Trichoplax sp. H2]